MALSTGLAWEMLSKDATSVTVGSFLLLHGCVALQAPLLRFTHSFLPRFLPPPRISPSGSSVCILSTPRPGIALFPSSGTLALSIFWKLSSWMLPLVQTWSQQGFLSLGGSPSGYLGVSRPLP